MAKNSSSPPPPDHYDDHHHHSQPLTQLREPREEEEEEVAGNLEESILLMERELKRKRLESLSTPESKPKKHHHHHSHQHHPPKMTDDEENLTFRVFFVKCPLEECCEFALKPLRIKQHLLSAHGIAQRCIATESCLRQQVNFSALPLLKKHLEEEHPKASREGFRCYRCGLHTGPHYRRLLRHVHFAHDEGHFGCRWNFKGKGCTFSAKYRSEVVSHWQRKHRRQSRSRSRSRGRTEGDDEDGDNKDEVDVVVSENGGGKRKATS